MTNQKTYFNGLNELRAIAALLVVFHHIELFKFQEGTASLLKLDNFVNYLGNNSVNLFFIISGFLITTILLEEKKKKNKINLKRFYARRALRIWPLYFITIILAFFFLPQLYLKMSESFFPHLYDRYIIFKNYNTKSFLLHFTFLSNLALIWYNKYVPAASQTWSVSIEEQFYIIWPLFIMLFNKKTMIFLLFLFILFYFLIFYSSDNLLFLIKWVFPFQYIFWGALGAYLYNVFSKEINRYSSSSTLFLITLLVTFLLLFFKIFSSNIQKNLINLFFLLILFFSINDDNLFSFRSQYFSRMGDISYGIYMLHPLVMYLVFPFANKYLLNNLLVFNIVVYTLIFSLTIALSHLSYKYFESYFLRIKEKKFSS